MRVALRSPALPAPLADTERAVVPDASQRAVHEANVRAPLDTPGGSPLAEVHCDRGDRAPAHVVPGIVTHIPLERKDSRRLVLHAERLTKDFGTQELALEVDVVRVDGTLGRVEARLSRTLTFEPARRARI